MSKGIFSITLKPQSTRTFNGVRIRNRGDSPAQLDLETSNWLTEERDRRSGSPIVEDSVETQDD